MDQENRPAVADTGANMAPSCIERLAAEMAKVPPERRALVAAQLIGICQGVQIAAKLEQAS